MLAFICETCGRNFKTLRGLDTHFGRTHKDFHQTGIDVHKRLRDNFSLIKEVEAILSGEKEAPFCSCGCGEHIDVKPWHKYDGIPKYILGHNSKNGNNSFLGCNHTEESKRLNRQKHLGENNPNFGKRGEGVTFFGGHHTKEAKRQIGSFHLGEKNVNWNDGSSTFEYPKKFGKDLKKYIRERDNNTCQLCGKTKEECGRKFSIHHIDYIKTNCEATNLITLCVSCNSKVNQNRIFWQEFFGCLICSKEGVLV